MLHDVSVNQLKGVGPALAATLAKLGIVSVQDLLFHFPHRYVDRTRITPINQLVVNNAAQIQGYVVKAQIMFGKRRSLAVTLEDDFGSVTLRFYHFNAAQKNRLEPGTQLRCFGEPRLGRAGIEFYHPEYSYIEAHTADKLEEALTPVYPLTEGLSQQKLRALVSEAVSMLNNNNVQELIPDFLPKHLRDLALSDAVRFLHQPDSNADTTEIQSGMHPAQQRLAYEELLTHFLARQKLKAEVLQHPAPQVNATGMLAERFLAQLPFRPTGAQRRVSEEILGDLTSGFPMLRMVQGDVGSGKTLVAALAALATVESGFQVAIVAPTEILAEQHFTSFKNWFSPLDIEANWLVGSLTTKKKQQVFERLASGTAQVVVGTHALLQDSVTIPNLGLSIIDEQHRFGVEQRLKLKSMTESGLLPHQLIMTATPIPRTLAMTAFAELDYSVIDELPPGRTPITTTLVNQQRRPELVARIKSALEQNKQVYWVCPLVEESETLSAANAETTSEALREHLHPHKIGLVHGRLKPDEKDRVMSAFKQGEISLLVATTVIEVGVDVPNASLIIIENPERLGLAQLHQLRGRVGRGNQASHCVLLYGEKLSENAKARLQVLRETNDGFIIAQKDLELRGPGELLGKRQTGDMLYRVADPIRDQQLVEAVHDIGFILFDQNQNISNQLISRWIGNAEKYAHA